MKHLSGYIVPLLADATGVGLALLLLRPLAQRFQEMAFINSVLLGIFFLLFFLGVYALKRLIPATSSYGRAEPQPLPSARILAVFGVLFALAYTLAIAYVVGFLDSVIHLNRQVLDEPSATMYLLLTPASWFGLSLLYMLMLSSPTESTVQPGTPRYAILAFLGLTAINLMAVVLTAVWHALWLRFEPPASSWWLAILIFIVYLILLAPPRFLYHLKQRSWLAALPFLTLLAWLAYLSSG